jgi:hypothetical protein
VQFVEPGGALERFPKGWKTGDGKLLHVDNALLAVFVAGKFFTHAVLLEIGRKH